MFLGDVNGKAVGRDALAAEPAEGLAGRKVDALHPSSVRDPASACPTSSIQPSSPDGIAREYQETAKDSGVFIARVN
jgi:hypothetical protein